MRSAAWAADWKIDEDFAKQLIGQAFPSLSPVSLRSFGEGWDNYAFLVNDTFIFRFPRRRIAAPIMETEIHLLPWLSSLLPVEIPNPRYVAGPSDQYPCSFAGYARVHGRILSGTHLADKEYESLGRCLGGFLAALHAVPADEARARGAGPDRLHRLDLQRRRTIAAERLEFLEQAGMILDRRRIDDVLDRLPVIAQPREDTLVHGDLHADQLILNDSGGLVGVIDWGDLHIGDPASDFAAVHAILPRHLQRHFLDTYGDVDPIRWMAARAIAIVRTIALAAHAVDVGNQQTIIEAKRSFEYLLN